MADSRKGASPGYSYNVALHPWHCDHLDQERVDTVRAALGCAGDAERALDSLAGDLANQRDEVRRLYRELGRVDRPAEDAEPATTAEPGPQLSRRALQRAVHCWCVAAFGDNHARNIEQRGLRMAEEAIEAAQAAGCDPATLHRLVDHVYGRPAGELHQELGGVAVTLLALAEAAGIDADGAERAEVQRILEKPLGYFAARNAAKDAAGFHVEPCRWVQPEGERK